MTLLTGGASAIHAFSISKIAEFAMEFSAWAESEKRKKSHGVSINILKRLVFMNCSRQEITSSDYNHLQ